MADFSSGIQPVIPNGTPNIVTPPNTTTANEINSAGNILGTIGSTVTQAFATNDQNKKQLQNASVLENFSQDLLKINDLEQSNVMKPYQAARAYRLRYATMIANFPTLQEQITKTYKDITGTPALGQDTINDLQKQKDDADQIQQSAKLDAEKAGFLKPNMTPDQQQQAVDLHQQFLLGQTQTQQAQALQTLKNSQLDYRISQNKYISSGLEISQQKQSLATGSINQKRAMLELNDAQVKASFRQGAANLLDSTYHLVDQNTDNIINNIGKPADPNDPSKGTYTQAMAIADMQRTMQTTMLHANGVAAAYDSEGTLNGLGKTLTDMIQIKTDLMTGKISTDVAQQKLNNQLALKQQQVATQDPDLITYAAVSRVMPAGMSELQVPIANSAVNSLKANGVFNTDGSVRDINAKPANLTNGHDDLGVDQHFSVLRGSIKSIQAGDKDPQLQQEVQRQIVKSFDSTSKYGQIIDSPADLNSTMKFYSDPTVGKYLSEHPDLVVGDKAEQAKSTLQVFYTSKVMPLIRDEFTRSSVPIGYRTSDTADAKAGYIVSADNRPVPEEIHMVFNGTGASFVPVANADRPSVQDKVKQLNNEVAPVINQLIRTSAHLSGSQDYSKFYKEYSDNLFRVPNPDADNKPVNTTGHDLGIVDENNSN